MAICTNCGHELEPGALFCKTCGHTVPEPAPAPKAPKASAQKEAPAPKAKKEPKEKKNLKDLFKIIDGTNFFNPEDINKNKIMALFSYIGFLFLIPLFACKDSKFARFHTNQGVVLCILNSIVTIIFGLMVFITALFYIPDVNVLHVLATIVIVCEALVWFVIGVPIIALTVLGIISAVTGKAKKLPVIGNVRILK